MTRFAFSRSLSCSISPKTVGTICHDTPNRSLSHPHCTSWPPAESFSPKESTTSSDRWHGAAVDHVFAPVNRGCAVGDEEGDEFSDLFGPAGPADRNSSQRIHQALARADLVGSAAFCEPRDEAMCSSCFDEAGRDGVHADTDWPDLL